MSLNIVELRNFTGGLNLRADAFQLAKNETSDLLNVEIDPRGGFFSRGGYQRINTSPVPYTGSWTPKRMHGFETADGSRWLLLSTLTQIFKSTGGNFEELKIGSTTSMPISSDWGAYITDWGDSAYITTGNSTPACKWSGSGYATQLTPSGAGQWQNNYASPTGTHMPKGKFVETHGDAMWVANVTIDGVNHPNRVYWSHTFNPESWAELDWIDVDGGGKEILGIVSVKGHLLVFKQTGIYAIYGYSKETYQLVTVSENIGLANPDSYAKSDKGIYFFDYPNGMFFYNGTGITDIFDSLRPLITERKINEFAIHSVSVSVVNRRVWLSIPEDASGIATKATVNYVYDDSIGPRGAWTRFKSGDNYGLVAGIDWADTIDTRFSIMVHPNQAYVCTIDNYSSASDNIDGTVLGFTSYYVTRWFDGDNFASKKMWKRPVFVVRAPSSDSSLTIEYYRDFNNGSAKSTFPLTLTSPTTGLIWSATATEPDANAGWNQANWSQGGAATLVVKGSALGMANSVQLKISGPTGLVWAVNSIMFKFNPRPTGA